MTKPNIIAAIVIAATLAAGCWFGWDRGLIPGNPRALTLAAAEPAARQSAWHALSQLPPLCAELKLRNPTPEISGFASVEPAPAPGLFHIILLNEFAQEQPARDRQIKQLEFLAKQGYFTARDREVQTSSGKKPAREYRITWEGFGQLGPNASASSMCFVAGQRMFGQATSMVESSALFLGLRVFDVAFTTTTVNLAKWAASEEAADLFPDYAAAKKAGVAVMQVVRGKDEWMPRHNAESMINADSSHPDYEKNRKWAKVAAMSPPLEEAAAQALTERLLKTDHGRGRTEFYCVPLGLSGTGDDKEAPKYGIKNVILYEDKADRQPFEFKELARRISVLEGLIAAGFAARETGFGPMPLADGEPELKKSAVDAGVNKAAWLRYRIDPAAMAPLQMSQVTGTGCIPLGKGKATYVGFVPYQNKGGVIKLRATFDNPPEIAKRLAPHVPAISIALSEGIALNANVQYEHLDSAVDKFERGNGKWSIDSFFWVRPQTDSSPFPPPWLAKMPLTAAIILKRPIPGTEKGYTEVASTLVAPTLSAPIPASAPSEKHAATEGNARQVSNGPTGLRQLLSDGSLRQATLGDFWLAMSPGTILMRLVRWNLSFDLQINDAYIILGKVTLPDDLMGVNAGVFVVPRGYPLPDGAIGHNVIYAAGEGMKCIAVMCADDH